MPRRHVLWGLVAGLTLFVTLTVAGEWQCDDGSCRWSRLIPPSAAAPRDSAHLPQSASADANSRKSVQQVPSYSDARGPVRVVNQRSIQLDIDDLPPRSAMYRGSYKAHGIVVVAPLPVYAEDGTAPLFPYMHADPAWKLCQFGTRHPHAQLYTHCGPYSYHPYGLYGYRPFGTYRPYLPAAGYESQPSARVIHVR